MLIQHPKSPCCRASVQRFGKRRRRCGACHHTWRIRQKKRGRKRIRVSPDLAYKFLNHEISSLRCLARQRKVGREYLRRRLERSLDHYLATTHVSYSLIKGSKPLVMIADAMWYWARDEKWTVYMILLKPLHCNTAVIMPALIYPGHECYDGWKIALESIEECRLKRVIALVSDGVNTLLQHATQYGWITQRCHFHLISSLQNYATTGTRSRNREFAITLMDTVKELITTHDEQRVAEIIESLTKLLLKLRSRGLRRVVSGLLKDLPQFRAYLTYPELNLPTTSNAAESSIQMIRNLLYRSRGFNTISSLQKWIRALFIAKPTIKCNGYKSTN